MLAGKSGWWHLRSPPGGRSSVSTGPPGAAWMIQKVLITECEQGWGCISSQTADEYKPLAQFFLCSISVGVPLNAGLFRRITHQVKQSQIIAVGGCFRMGKNFVSKVGYR